MTDKQAQEIRASKRAKFDPSERKRKSAPTPARTTKWWIAAGAALAVVLLVWLWQGRTGQSSSIAESGELPPARDGAYRLPAALFGDGQARTYTHQADGKSIQFFVIKSRDGVIRAAFNACDVCFLEKAGYHQEGDEMVCNACGQRFPSELINEVRGGCNPSPLERTIEGDEVVIRIQDILAGANYF